jgi:hypothetical protein
VGWGGGAGSDFCGPMGKQQRMFLVTVAALYMGLAPDSWRRGWCAAEPGLGAPAAALALIILGSTFTAWRRLARAGAKLREAHQ